MKEPMMADSHEITVRNYKHPMRNRLIMMLICIGIALASFFVVSKWATSVESYRWVIKTLNGLQKKALGLSGTATALATGAAAIPGEAATPIANKLADVAGYMVIVYAVIIVEKYLLTITGYIAFKISRKLRIQEMQVNPGSKLQDVQDHHYQVLHLVPDLLPHSDQCPSHQGLLLLLYMQSC